MHIYSLLQFNHLMSFIIICVMKTYFYFVGLCSFFCQLQNTVKAFLFLGDYQNFAGSWESNFMGNWFAALQCKTIHYFVKRSWGHKFVGRCNPQNPRTLPPPPPPPPPQPHHLPFSLAFHF